MTSAENLPQEESPKKKSFFKKIQWKKIYSFLKFKIPLGVVFAVFIAMSVYFIFDSFSGSKDSTLGPAVKGARDLSVNITMCNERVDELELDVREEELKLQERFEDNEDVLNVRFKIDRINCDENLETQQQSDEQSNLESDR